LSLRFRASLPALILVLAATACSVPAATLDTHTVVLDTGGKLLSWVAPQDQAYDRVMFLSWDLLRTRVPDDPANGLLVYFTHSEYRISDLTGTGWPNNAAGKHAMLSDAAAMYYAYTGDTGVIDLVRALLDHHLANGTTPAGYDWARVPWSTGAAGSVTYGNDNTVEGVGVLEPDKIGELGYHGYLRLYELTGDTRYRDAAIDCATALASHVRIGSATQSPWPFRVNAQSGAIVEDYCADVIAPIRLFDELIRLGLGNVAAYQSARQTAWTWLMAYPMSNSVWVNYFEDIAVQSNRSNLNQYDAGQTARYLLEHPEIDASWRTHSSSIIAWIELNFGGTDHGESGVQFGARVISEQTLYQYKMASHTSRYAAINALYAEATGDAAAKDKAFRSLNWSTYMCRNNGVVIEGPAEAAANSPCWFTDGHGDYVRNLMLALGAFPEWAPAGEDHLLRSSSVVQSVSYAADQISYRTFDTAATEVLRLSAMPSRVLASGVELARRGDLSQPGWTFDAATGATRIRHDAANQVVIELGAASPPPPSTSLLRVEATPNPSKGTVQVDVDLPTGGWVDVFVRDVSGKTIHTIHSGDLTAGPHRIGWDGRDAEGHRVGSGVYFVQARTRAGEKANRLIRIN